MHSLTHTHTPWGEIARYLGGLAMGIVRRQRDKGKEEVSRASQIKEMWFSIGRHPRDTVILPAMRHTILFSCFL